MQKQDDFLVEIGTEELPAAQISNLVQQFAQQLKIQLEKEQLAFTGMELFSTPRRLAVLIKNIDLAQNDREIERRGPALSAAYDANGQLTPAALGFAQSCSIAPDQLTTMETEKGKWLYCRYTMAGEAAEILLPRLVKEALSKIPISKPMRWASHDFDFIRPIQWAVMLLGNKALETELYGVYSANKTYGHRFHHPEAITLAHPRDYVKTLKENNVIVDLAERKKIIAEQIQQLASEIQLQAIIDDDLLNEVTGLVEWPVALRGTFEKEFLEVPAEAIITAMKNHQRCFALVDKHQKLQPYFITISNIESKDPQRVISGNERVIRARLSDAQFFFHSDHKHHLEHRLQELKSIVFQRKLGSLFDKAERVSKLAEYLASLIQANTQEAARAGLLAKADLTTAMVGEFPELQGIMGAYYASHEGESDAVATAIREHYQPRFAKDELPNSSLGVLVALADKIDTLIGIFGINLIPTGEKDPFALRRAALGIVRILVEKNLAFDLRKILQIAKDFYQVNLENTAVIDDVLSFILERLRAWYQEQGLRADLITAVMSRQITQPLDIHHRLQAVKYFISLPQSKSLTAANKRVSNILKKTDGIHLSHTPVNPSLLKEPAEHQLAEVLEQKTRDVEMLCEQARYQDALKNLSELQEPVDHFFDDVMVMVDDPALRENRLVLLSQIRQLFLRIADISLLQGE
jgi:glycyl-tRNA synthetase beta chain